MSTQTKEPRTSVDGEWNIKGGSDGQSEAASHNDKKLSATDDMNAALPKRPARIETRNDVTQFLHDKLIGCRLSGFGSHFASEVTFDYGTQHPKRVDFVQFRPKNGMFADGIEKGEFTCYEIKSCREDLYSGHGINFFGEQNYFVMTMQTWKDVQEDFRSGKIKRYISDHFPGSSNYWGVIVIIPSHRTAEEEFLLTTGIDEDCGWKAAVIIPCRKGPRKRSMVEMLFCMIRSGR